MIYWTKAAFTTTERKNAGAQYPARVTNCPDLPTSRIRLSAIAEDQQGRTEMSNEEATQYNANSTSNVWLVKGGPGNGCVDTFVSHGYVGFDYEMNNVDLSRVKSKAEIRELHRRENAYVEYAKSGRKSVITRYVNQVSKFVLDFKIGDYVIMPGTSSSVVHYGTVRSDVYHVPDDDGLTFGNRRTVAWKGVFTREDQTNFKLVRSISVRPVKNKEKAKFFKILPKSR